jgi:D-arabinose 1-dehydrogenase-like Zn-dependent alcohol dehydrogenase
MPVYRSRDVDASGGCRYGSAEIFETLNLIARGRVRPMVTEISPMAEAEAVHERIEQGAVTGRAALLIGS